MASLNLIRGIDTGIEGGEISEVEKGKENERGETEVLQEIGEGDLMAIAEVVEASLGNGKQEIEGTQLMILDKTVQKVQETELDHLINIPIEMPESSGIIKEILGIDQGNQ